MEINIINDFNTKIVQVNLQINMENQTHYFNKVTVIKNMKLMGTYSNTIIRNWRYGARN